MFVCYLSVPCDSQTDLIWKAQLQKVVICPKSSAAMCTTHTRRFSVVCLDDLFLVSPAGSNCATFLHTVNRSESFLQQPPRWNSCITVLALMRWHYATQWEQSLGQGHVGGRPRLEKHWWSVERYLGRFLLRILFCISVLWLKKQVWNLPSPKHWRGVFPLWWKIKHSQAGAACWIQQVDNQGAEAHGPISKCKHILFVLQSRRSWNWLLCAAS